RDGFLTAAVQVSAPNVPLKNLIRPVHLVCRHIQGDTGRFIESGHEDLLTAAVQVGTPDATPTEGGFDWSSKWSQSVLRPLSQVRGKVSLETTRLASSSRPPSVPMPIDSLGMSILLPDAALADLVIFASSDRRSRKVRKLDLIEKFGDCSSGARGTRQMIP